VDAVVDSHVNGVNSVGSQSALERLVQQRPLQLVQSGHLAPAADGVVGVDAVVNSLVSGVNSVASQPALERLVQQRLLQLVQSGRLALVQVAEPLRPTMMLGLSTRHLSLRFFSPFAP
ncbi:MAG: hypothetical protein NT029_06215, partial [Armatimonadetes bacterium]|nr:hypothetical protein [Armatimonadota bacterium]